MSGIFSLVNRIVRNSLYGCQVFVRVFLGLVLRGDGMGFVLGGCGGVGVLFLWDGFIIRYRLPRLKLFPIYSTK